MADGSAISDGEPLARRTTSEQVAHEIRRLIWSGQLGAGEHLAQEDLASSMGVSRIPVREALIALAHEGSVRTEPHRGSFVETLTEADVTDHYDLFGHIDGFALRRAIERAECDELDQLAADLESAAAIESARAMQSLVVATRTRFHDLGGSPRFKAVARGLTGLVAGNFFDEVPGAIGVAQRRLPEVGVAVRSADADAAVTGYESMMMEHGVLVLDALKARGLLG